MIKAVFFDLFHTLIHFHPPREEVLAMSLSRRGINAETGKLKRAVVAGDEYYYRENARKDSGKHTKADAGASWHEWQSIVLREAGIEPRSELVTDLLADIQRTSYEHVLYNDVLPTLASLSNRGLKLGLISNVNQNIGPLVDQLGLSPYLEVVLTSRDLGVTKPEPRIFQEAVRMVGVMATNVIYVGDQYKIDVLGARGAGLKGLLLDREGNYPEIAGTEKIFSLDELENRIQQYT